ncbi:hypothetical protein BCR32DRAFT_294489 [Anaeromyces robustus]|uniref:Uncharacterized protein n=1 Tax=Anaeromyces robustus TaxID=1754192 RepID=A0A1Y1X0U4_9FUNG|nr:hypothetical protein BCR32DRAFT_294489 [Anaeromyces robustus]|eukprot:ORX79383.1 hypothetical protein BCR32DRAFT_294489 [Anaeromyces robustus]
MNIEESKTEITIPEDEIIDYLVTKNYIKENWYEKINSSLTDLEELLLELKESCFDLVHQKYKEYGMTYYDLLSVIQALKRLDNADKGLFGKYNSERVNKSLNIKSIWEENNSWIAETSRIYTSSHQFQLSNLKKDQQSLTDYIKDVKRFNDILEKENQKLVNDWKSIILNDEVLNKNIKINNNSINILSKDDYLSYYHQYLENILKEIIEKIQTNEIKEGIQYYKATEYLTSKENIEDTDDNDNYDTNSLIHLEYLIKKGNTSIDDYKSFFNISKVQENIIDSFSNNKTIFYNNEIRNQIFTEIQQLYCFISQRYQELNNYSTNLIASYILQHSPSIIRKQSSKSLLALINHLKDIVNQFELFNETWLKAYSKGYQNDILDKLNSNITQIHYQEEKIQKNKERLIELQNKLNKKIEQVKTVQVYTDDLKSNLEKSLSKMLKKAVTIKDYK